MKRNRFLDTGFSDESDQDDGYDSEAAELSKGRKAVEPARKRRKLSTDDTDEEGKAASEASAIEGGEDVESDLEEELQDDKDRSTKPAPTPQRNPAIARTRSDPSTTQQLPLKRPAKKSKKETIPGVIYLSSLPPYLKPSALRNLLEQRGFTPISRLFLVPASKAKSTSKKNSRQLYAEGWIEFASKKTARRCAETLNAGPVGGKKGGFYHDDIWNIKYLKGLSWGELMAAQREERREEEGRRDEERRFIARETKGFLEAVEEGKRVVGMRRKKAGKEDGMGGMEEARRTWRQIEGMGGKDVKRSAKGEGGKGPVNDEDVKRVLGKIF